MSDSGSEGGGSQAGATDAGTEFGGTDAGGGAAAPAESDSSIVSVTADFSMQNVLLQMGLRLATPDCRRITRLSRWVLRCSACFFVTKVRASGDTCPAVSAKLWTRLLNVTQGWRLSCLQHLAA